MQFVEPRNYIGGLGQPELGYIIQSNQRIVLVSSSFWRLVFDRLDLRSNNVVPCTRSYVELIKCGNSIIANLAHCLHK